MQDKFNEIKTLIQGGYISQAQDECDNGVNQSVELRNALENIKKKAIEIFGEHEIFSDLQNIIDTI